MAKKNIVHLFKNDDPTKRVCDEEPYIPPVGAVGDTMELCKQCDSPLHREPPPSGIKKH